MTDSDGYGGPALRRRRLDAVAFGLVIVIASVVPVPGATGGADGTAFPFGVGLTDPFHVVGYAVLAALVVRTGAQRWHGRVAALLVAVAVAVTVGFGVELVQATVPWRSFAWRDAGINAAGAVVGAVIAVVRSGASPSPGGRG